MFTTMHAEEFPTRIEWTWRETLVVCFVPALLLLGYAFEKLSIGLVPTVLADTTLRIAFFVALVVLYRRMLAEHWRRLGGSWGRLLLLVVVGAIVLQVVISLVQSVNPWAYSAADAASAGGASAGGAAAEATIGPVTASGALLAVAVYATLGPLVMALIEDIVFRYTLLHRLYLPRVWLRVLLIVGGGILFGAVHFHNFGGLGGTIGYMVAGILLNLLYVWTRNIWPVLLIHTLNNLVLGLGAMLLILVLRAIGAVG